MRLSIKWMTMDQVLTPLCHHLIDSIPMRHAVDHSILRKEIEIILKYSRFMSNKLLVAQRVKFA